MNLCRDFFLFQIQLLRHNVFCHKEADKSGDDLTQQDDEKHRGQKATEIIRRFRAGHTGGIYIGDAKSDSGQRQNDGGKDLYGNVAYDVDADGSEDLMIRDKASHCHTEIQVQDRQKRRQKHHNKEDPAESRQRGQIMEATSKRRQQYGHKLSVCKHDKHCHGQHNKINDGPQKTGESLGDDDLRRCDRQSVGQVSLLGKYIFIKAVADIYGCKYGHAKENQHEEEDKEACDNTDGCSCSRRCCHIKASACLKEDAGQYGKNKYESVEDKQQLRYRPPFVFE